MEHNFYVGDIVKSEYSDKSDGLIGVVVVIIAEERRCLINFGAGFPGHDGLDYRYKQPNANNWWVPVEKIKHARRRLSQVSTGGFF